MRNFKSEFFKGYKNSTSENNAEYKSDFFYSKDNWNKAVTFLNHRGWVVYSFIHECKNPCLGKQYWYNAILYK